MPTGFAIVVFLCFIAYRLWHNKKITLDDAVKVILSGGMIPLAIAFTIYPFQPNLITSIEKMSLQITLTGLVLLFVYIRTIIETMTSDGS